MTVVDDRGNITRIGRELSREERDAAREEQLARLGILVEQFTQVSGLVPKTTGGACLRELLGKR